MSLCIFIGVGVGCWALLSVVSGECLRQQQAMEAEREARQRALLAAEDESA